MRYPVWMVSVEAGFVANRLSVQMANETQLMLMALSSIPNMGADPKGTKRVAKSLEKLLKGMMDGE